jgi:aminoglycoside phosphotransferase (APT) family kinase protein
VEGIDEGPVTAWLEENVDSLVAPFRFELVAGGRSNLTYRVGDSAGHQVVLRRPPSGYVLPTAHDMGREYRVVTALYPTPVPVPQTLGYCSDPDVTGAPFYVMELVHGHVVRDIPSAKSVLDERGRRRAGESLVDVLASLHEVDVDVVGLGDLGRREGYIARQLERWHGQFEQSQIEGVDRVVTVDHVYEVLASSIPPQGRASIVHGDYRLDNTLVTDDGSVAAVLDWEICTLGDQLADLGVLMVYWTEPGDDFSALGLAPTSLPGFPTRSELAARYSERTGLDLSGLDYYTAFGYWKIACILQGVQARYAAGFGAGDRTGTDAFGAQVSQLAEQALKKVKRLGSPSGKKSEK